MKRKKAVEILNRFNFDNARDDNTFVEGILKRGVGKPSPGDVVAAIDFLCTSSHSLTASYGEEEKLLIGDNSAVEELKNAGVNIPVSHRGRGR